MELRQCITKGLAILLLLVFSQKIGVGIYLHNLLHYNECTQLEQSFNGLAISKACNCIDDFSLPFTEPVLEIISPNTFPAETNSSFQIASVPFSIRLFSSLRGPPVSLS